MPTADSAETPSAQPPSDPASTPSGFLRSAPRDFLAGAVVFLVALPLCLGVALASGAPLFSGLVAGIVGGIVVGFLSGSHTSVSGPAAGLTAVVAAQIAAVGSFENFLAAVMLAGAMQVVLGVLRAGFIAAFFPSSVIKGLLAAIGVILILKQIPHVLGHDPDPVGEMAFNQADGQNTLSELLASFFDIQPGAAAVGLLSFALLLLWDRVAFLKKSPVPAPLIVVVLGVVANQLLGRVDAGWLINNTHMVQVPVSESLDDLAGLLRLPEWSAFARASTYMAALTIAILASLETLLNLQAVDNVDPLRRASPPNRELIAQGIGNMTAGLIGGLPMTSVIVRSSVNVMAGGRTRTSTIVHGALLLISVVLIPTLINKIPLASLAAILLATGLKLASPKLVREMWKQGRRQFLPFVITVIAIVATDLLIGIIIGLCISLAFILHSSFKSPLRRIVEKHAMHDVLRIELSSQVGFFSRGRLEKELDDVPAGGHVLIDARRTEYLDPDVLALLKDYHTNIAPARGVILSLLGFKDSYGPLVDSIQFVDHSTRDVQSKLTPDAVLEILKEGNRRFRTGQPLSRDLVKQMSSTAAGQAPLAVVVSCIDSRAPVEFLFDLGIGDVFSIRVAGNVARQKVFGSLEFATAVAGAKLIVVLGHTSCGAVSAAVKLRKENRSALAATGCENLGVIVEEIQTAIPDSIEQIPPPTDAGHAAYVDGIARKNVARVMHDIRVGSRKIHELVSEGRVAVVGGLYNVATGVVEFDIEDVSAHSARR